MAKKKEETVIKIKEKAVFDFVYEHNAINVASALSSAGYFVRMRTNGTGKTVEIYTHA